MPFSIWLVLIVAGLSLSCGRHGVALPEPPSVRSEAGVVEMTLTAAQGSDERSVFVFDGRDVPPTIRVAPGDTLKIHYVNALPPRARAGAQNAAMHMTNLHFHGLGVSPMRPQDNVLDMIAMPGEALDYAVRIPRDHLPGLYWYHTHPHGESEQQVLDGMSGALIIEGIDRYAPELRGIRERVLVIRADEIGLDSSATAKKARVDLERGPCGESHDTVSRLFTVNGVLRPEIDMRPAERQFWRIVNAAPDRYVDIELTGQRFEVVAYDGFPIGAHDHSNPTRLVDHVFVPPAGRVEAIVEAPIDGRQSRLRTRCVDTGPDGDPNPGMILADVVVRYAPPTAAAPPRVVSTPPSVTVLDVESVKRRPPAFTATFTEGEHRFYINNQLFSLDAEPMVRVKVGQFQHWKIVNSTREIHPLHIHQAHFLTYQENDRPVPDPQWLDTVNVPVGGSIDVIMDFTNPIIRGMSVFHCHLLNHEDKGMMAKILFE